MRKFQVLLTFLLGFVVSSFAAQPVEWTAVVDLASNNEGVLKISAEIEDGWKLYGMDLPLGGPVSTNIQIEATGAEMKGDLVAETKCISANDETFQSTLEWWEGNATFSQRFKVVDQSATFSIKIRYMSCDGTTCTRPTNSKLVIEINK
ncbi:MAG: protein-disulfide reductase DsbD family protein [Muribaculaceae bacterium]|jgi:thiol:disulfide interchange protein DsbD|nr:protein-disulfide reductase DsbD family protein [Muribaculaceae bacterium]